MKKKLARSKCGSFSFCSFRHLVCEQSSSDPIKTECVNEKVVFSAVDKSKTNEHFAFNRNPVSYTVSFSGMAFMGNVENHCEHFFRDGIHVFICKCNMRTYASVKFHTHNPFRCFSISIAPSLSAYIFRVEIKSCSLFGENYILIVNFWFLKLIWMLLISIGLRIPCNGICSAAVDVANQPTRYHHAKVYWYVKS